MIRGIARYEWKLQLRSLVFWLGLVLIGMMFYAEVYAEQAAQVQVARAFKAGTDPKYARVQMSPEMQAMYEKIAAEGIDPVEHASQWADRMQIVFAFVVIFTVGFMLERDRLSRTHEPLLSRPVSGPAYIGGKYLGALLPLLLLSLLTALAAAAVGTWLNSGYGRGWELAAYLKAWAFLLAPMLLYVTALILTLSLLLGRGAAVVPIHLAYMAAGGLVPWGEQGFRLDLTTFIIRTEGRVLTIWTDDFSTLLANRGLYLGLTAALLAMAMALYSRRAGREV